MGVMITPMMMMPAGVAIALTMVAVISTMMQPGCPLKRFTITDQWIDQHRSDRGGWTRTQIEALGESWPLQAGWRRRAIGRQISDDAKTRFEVAMHANQIRMRAKQARVDATLDLFR